MSDSRHIVIIGNGVAGNEAAHHLRQRDPDCRITIISAGRLLFYNRYELPRMFTEDCDWRDFRNPLFAEAYFSPGFLYAGLYKKAESNPLSKLGKLESYQ